MAQTDPRFYIKSLICEAAWYLMLITKDDNVTVASVLCEYERGPEDIKHIFYTEGYDVLVKFGEPQVRSERQIQDVPVHYLMVYPVTVITVDKHAPLLGPIVCTATTMQAKARTAIRTILSLSAQSAVPAFTLTIMREQGRNDWMGGINIHRTVYYIEYMTA